MASKTLDLITIGRASVDLYGQQIGSRLEDITSFAKSVGGCPANIAIGASRLGLRTGFITRVGNEQMGRFIREQMAREGVAPDGIVTDDQRLTALAILAVESPSTFPLLFYRENCADMALGEADIDPGFIGSSRAVLVTGTHFSKRIDRKGAAEGDAPRPGKRRQGDLRYRLPAEPVGPCRPRRRRASATSSRNGFRNISARFFPTAT